MAIRHCAYCGVPLGLDVPLGGTETVCAGCTARLAAESALTHALVGVHAIASELERALADVWRGLPPSAHPRRRRSDRP
jgi:hypothetical protein